MDQVRLNKSQTKTINTFTMISPPEPQEAKESDNPIYEGPLYENVEEQQRQLPLPPLPSARRRLSKGLVTSVENMYHSSPIPVPSGSDSEGLYAELAARKRESQATPTGDGEEEVYTIMSPVGPAERAAALSFTPYLEDRAAWISNRK